ncbi:MAG: NADH:flavin oxidoreductase/NADH oxidase [Pseudomonadota bacterium]|nr:NADH:flavin oxidoreductase/NADH oxidase [Pseudomonadota bacterium]MEC7514114.1 NADH:flavin oxidoreductase/NADH oxidase [Pseudomonadota bacterium]MEC8583390.1 NADH:flavin oxidoreductase/NADH oxidase [Pseudomonadota bacterium]MEC8675725.1 NADH:flavin oxidoreductase/NADH oxidase [Pseudomonadota bacterium]MEC8846004.1 NADH:flavin oxidoreductase/NADH oxidase [Pseudomonadota bacterium]
MSTSPQLFSPLTLRGVTLPNRIVLSPLCMYSGKDGVANDWHFAHLSTFARGRVGLIFAEATAVEPRGRITPRCLGIWNDEQVEAFKPITAFIESMGSVPAIQLAHAGRKASSHVPWMGGKHITAADAVPGEDPWPVVGPSATAVAEGFQTPHQLTVEEIQDLAQAFADAAVRSIAAGFKVIELHGAHGYLMHSFLSPLANTRNDQYGGDITGRMRFPLEVVDAVRKVIPEDMPLFFRISAIDGPAEGWTMDDSVVLGRELAARGVDVVDCSSGGIAGAPRFRSNDEGKPLASPLDRGLGFQVPYAERVKAESDIKTMAVGLIVDPQQAEDILVEGRADLVALGRELMFNPFWALHAAQALDHDPNFKMWPDQYAWGVFRRAQLANFKDVRTG